MKNQNVITDKEKALGKELAKKLEKLNSREISVVVGLIDGFVLAKQINTDEHITVS